MENDKKRISKRELILELQKKLELKNQTIANDILDAFCEIIKDHIVNDEEVSLPTVGTFYAKHIEAKPIRNPRTGEVKDTPAHIVPRFRVSPNFKKLFQTS